METKTKGITSICFAILAFISSADIFEYYYLINPYISINVSSIIFSIVAIYFGLSARKEKNLDGTVGLAIGALVLLYNLVIVLSSIAWIIYLNQ